MITLKQIAAECNVSVASVSKALNNLSDISPATAEKIKNKARELGYYPNSAARALKTSRSDNIGVLFVDATHSGLTHEYFADVLDAVKTSAESAGFDVTFISSNLGGSSMSYYEHCKYRNCDGVIIASVDFSDVRVIELLNSEIPVVTIDYTFKGRSSVLSDNYRGMTDLVSHIYDMGHRKIAFVHGEQTAVTKKRIEGFKDFCTAHDIFAPDYLIPGAYHDPKTSGKVTRSLMSLENPPTCIIYPDDISMLGGMTELNAKGYSIPDDISVAGYDGISMSRILRPVLTTLRQNSRELGTKAVELLVNQIENPTTFTPVCETVKGFLQIGETVKPIEIN